MPQEGCIPFHRHVTGAGAHDHQSCTTPYNTNRSGHMQNVQAELGSGADRDVACLCGNPDMVDAAFAALKKFGLPVPQITCERYISSR